MIQGNANKCLFNFIFLVVEMLRQMIPNRMCSSSESIPSCLEIEKEGLALTLMNIALENFALYPCRFLLQVVGIQIE